MTSSALLWLLPLAPLLGAAVSGLAGRRLGRRAVHAVAIAAVAVSAAAALGAVTALVALPPEGRLIVARGWTILDLPPLRLDLALALDPLSAVMALVVTLAGTLVHVYATGYMKDDPGFPRFFAALNLFVAAMLLLVLADSLLLVFFGWEGVGLCSWLLVGFWYRDADKAAAGTKAFLTNRVGDAGLLLGIALLLDAAGTLNFRELAATPLPPATAIGAAVLLFVGMAGKSAQLPLHVWLPDAMAGPTPVSALIHAATMVTAGVYLAARMSFLFLGSAEALTLLAAAGLLTALLGALFAVFEHDLKRVLAYSTISQLGFMFLAAGVGAFGAAVFHLVTHAAFKACLFLAAGAVIHGTHAQDLRALGGLAPLMPRTRRAYLLGCLAIAGFPIAAGFYSKDEILLRAFAQQGALLPGPLLWAVALLTAGLTSFYMFRSYYLVFHGRAPASAAAHDPPRAMGGVLAVLGTASVVLGPVLGWPEAWGGHPFLERFLAPVLAPAPGRAVGLPLALLLQLAGVSVALAGWAAARRLYRDAEASEPARARLAARLPRAHRLLERKLHLDRALEALVRDPGHDLPAACAWIDRHVVDRGVHLLARTATAVAAVGGFVDRFLVDGLVNGVAAAAQAGGRRLARLQTGRINSYVLGITVGLVMLVVVSWFAL